MSTLTPEPAPPAHLTDVLAITLQLAVPLHIDALRDRTDDQRVAIASRCATTISSHGDALQFGGRHCAEAFNALAEGLAVAAYLPGGVTFAGVLHWCTVPHEGCPQKAAW